MDSVTHNSGRGTQMHIIGDPVPLLNKPDKARQPYQPQNVGQESGMQTMMSDKSRGFGSSQNKFAQSGRLGGGTGSEEHSPQALAQRKETRSFRKTTQRHTVARQFEALNTSVVHEPDILPIVQSKNSPNRPTRLNSRSSIYKRKRSNFQNATDMNHEKSQLNSDLQDFITKKKAKKPSQKFFSSARKFSKQQAPDEIQNVFMQNKRIESEALIRDLTSASVDSKDHENKIRKVTLFDSHQIVTLANASPNASPVTNRNQQAQIGMNNLRIEQEDLNLHHLDPAAHQDDSSQQISQNRRFRGLDPNLTNSTLGLSQPKELQKTTSNVYSHPSIPFPEPREPTDERTKENIGESGLTNKQNENKNRMTEQSIQGWSVNPSQLNTHFESLRNLNKSAEKFNQQSQITMRSPMPIGRMHDQQNVTMTHNQGSQVLMRSPMPNRTTVDLRHQMMNQRRESSLDNTKTSDKVEVLLIGQDQNMIKKVQQNLQMYPIMTNQDTQTPTAMNQPPNGGTYDDYSSGDRRDSRYKTKYRHESSKAFKAKQQIARVNIGADALIRDKLKYPQALEQQQQQNATAGTFFNMPVNEQIQPDKRFQRQVRLEEYQNVDSANVSQRLHQSAYVTPNLTQSQASSAQKQFHTIGRPKPALKSKNRAKQQLYWQTSSQNMSSLDSAIRKSKDSSPSIRHKSYKVPNIGNQQQRMMSFNEFSDLLRQQGINLSPIERKHGVNEQVLLDKFNKVHQIMGGSSREAQQLKTRYLKMLLSKSINTGRIMPVIDSNAVRSNIQNKAHMHQWQSLQQRPDQRVIEDSKINPALSRNRVGLSSVENVKQVEQGNQTSRMELSRQFHIQSSQRFTSNKSEEKLINLQRVQSTSININESINDYNSRRRLENRSRALSNDKSADSQFKSMYKSRRDELTINNSQYSIHHIVSTHDQVYEGSNDSKRTNQRDNKRGSQQSFSQMMAKPKNDEAALSPILSQVQNEYSESPMMTQRNSQQIIKIISPVKSSQQEEKMQLKKTRAKHDKSKTVDWSDTKNTESNDQSILVEKKQSKGPETIPQSLLSSARKKSQTNSQDDLNQLIRNQERDQHNNLLVNQQFRHLVQDKITEALQESSHANTFAKEYSINEAQSFMNKKSFLNAAMQTGGSKILSTKRLTKNMQDLELTEEQLKLNDHSVQHLNDVLSSEVKDRDRHGASFANDQGCKNPPQQIVILENSTESRRRNHSDEKTYNDSTARGSNASRNAPVNGQFIQIQQPEVSMMVTKGSEHDGLQPKSVGLTMAANREKANKTEDPRVSYLLNNMDIQDQLENAVLPQGNAANGGGRKEGAQMNADRGAHQQQVKLPQIGSNHQQKNTTSILKNMNFQYPSLQKQLQNSIEFSSRQPPMLHTSDFSPIGAPTTTSNSLSKPQQLSKAHMSSHTPGGLAGANLPRLRMVNSSKLDGRQGHKGKEKQQTSGGAGHHHHQQNSKNVRAQFMRQVETSQSSQESKENIQKSLMMRGTNLRQHMHNDEVITSIQEASLDSQRGHDSIRKFDPSKRHASIEDKQNPPLLPKKKYEERKQKKKKARDVHDTMQSDFYKQFKSQFATDPRAQLQMKYQLANSYQASINENGSSERNTSQMSVTQPLILSKELQKELQQSNQFNVSSAMRNQKNKFRMTLNPDSQLKKRNQNQRKLEAYTTLPTEIDRLPKKKLIKPSNSKIRPAAPIFIPNPSSMKDLLADGQFYDKLQRRMHDEAEDMQTCVRTKAMAMSCKHVASGRYGVGRGAYNQVRLDSAQKRRDMQRMNWSIRHQNLQKVEFSRRNRAYREQQYVGGSQEEMPMHQRQDQQPSTVVVKLRLKEKDGAGEKEQEEVANQDQQVKFDGVDEELFVDYFNESQLNGLSPIQRIHQQSKAQVDESISQFKPTQFSHRILDQIVIKESQDNKDTHSKDGANKSKEKQKQNQQMQSPQKKDSPGILVDKSGDKKQQTSNAVLTRVATGADLMKDPTSMETSNESIDSPYLKPGGFSDPKLTEEKAKGQRQQRAKPAPARHDSTQMAQNASSNFKNGHQNADLLSPKHNIEQANMLNTATLTMANTFAMQSPQDQFITNAQEYLSRSVDASPALNLSKQANQAMYYLPQINNGPFQRQLEQLVTGQNQTNSTFKINPQRIEISKPQHLHNSTQMSGLLHATNHHNPFFKPQIAPPSDQVSIQDQTMYLNETSGDLFFSPSMHPPLNSSHLHLHPQSKLMRPHHAAANTQKRISQQPLSHYSIKKTANQIVSTALESAERRIGHRERKKRRY